MKRTVNRVPTRALRGGRKSVAQILRESYERFARDEEALIAMKAVLRPGAKPES